MELEDDDLSERVYEELEFRSETLGELYPFELVREENYWALRTRTLERLRSVHDSYVACLLISIMHSELLPLPETDELLKKSRRVMQMVSYLMSAEILRGEAFWMGAPRPDHSGMLAAIKNLVTEMGHGISYDEVPDGLDDHGGDGSVDIVVWRTFADQMRGILVGYGQVAAGREWESKPVGSHIRGRFLPWFVKTPSHNYLELLFIPVLQHQNLNDDPSKDFWVEAQA